MPVLMSSVLSIVRAIVIDRIDGEITPAFTDAEILVAVNSTINGFFGIRPEAFSVGSIATEPPAAVSITVGFPQKIIVTGATLANVNGDYDLAGMHDGKLYWSNAFFFIYYSVAEASWFVSDTLGEEASPVFFVVSSEDLPDKTGWGGAVETDFPALAYSLDDAEIDIAGWAVQQFCYGVAAFLLMQRGKDSFYRKAADALNKLYLGR